MTHPAFSYSKLPTDELNGGQSVFSSVLKSLAEAEKFDAPLLLLTLTRLAAVISDESSSKIEAARCSAMLGYILSYVTMKISDHINNVDEDNEFFELKKICTLLNEQYSAMSQDSEGLLLAALTPGVPESFVNYCVKSIFSSSSFYSNKINTTSVVRAFSSEWRVAFDTLRSEEAMPIQVGLALAVSMLSENIDNHTFIFSLLHQKWRSHPFVISILFNTESNAHLSSYPLTSDSKHSTFQIVNERLAEIVCDSIRQDEDPRKSEALIPLLQKTDSMDEYSLVLNGARIAGAPWLNRALVSAIGNFTQASRELYNAITALTDHGGPECVEALRIGRSHYPKGDERWFLATLGMAQHDDPEALDQISKAAAKNSMNLWASINGEEFVEKIENDKTGKLTNVLWNGIYKCGKAQSETILFALLNKKIDDQLIIPRAELEEYVQKILSSKKLQPFELSIALKIGTVFQISLSDDQLSAVISKKYRRNDLISSISSFLVSNLNQNYPETFKIIRAKYPKLIRTVENIELIKSGSLSPLMLPLKLTADFSVYKAILSDCVQFASYVVLPALNDEVLEANYLNSLFSNKANREEFYEGLEEGARQLESQDKRDDAFQLRTYREALITSQALGISKPFRFKPSELLQLTQARMHPKSCQGKPIVVMCFASFDWNGAFSNLSSILKPYFENNYAVLYYEIKEKEELVDALEEVRVEYHQKASAIWIAAHAAPQSLQYSKMNPEHDLTTEDSQILRNLSLNRTLEPGGQLILKGCSTKRPLAGALTIGSSFEFAASSVKDVEVVASELITYTSMFSFALSSDKKVRVSLPRRGISGG